MRRSEDRAIRACELRIETPFAVSEVSYSLIRNKEKGVCLVFAGV